MLGLSYRYEQQPCPEHVPASEGALSWRRDFEKEASQKQREARPVLDRVKLAEDTVEAAEDQVRRAQEYAKSAEDELRAATEQLRCACRHPLFERLQAGLRAHSFERAVEHALRRHCSGLPGVLRSLAWAALAWSSALGGIVIQCTLDPAQSVMVMCSGLQAICAGIWRESADRACVVDAAPPAHTESGEAPFAACM